MYEIVELERIDFATIPTVELGAKLTEGPAQVAILRDTRPVSNEAFEPHPHGTLLTYRADFDGFGPAARVFRWFIARNFHRAKPRVLDLIRREAAGR